MTVLRTTDSWRLVTLDGTLVPLRVAEGADLQIGEPKRELVQAPFSSAVFMADGDGEWTAREVPVEFIVRGRTALDKYGARTEERVTKEALREAAGLYGARSYEGLYLPLQGALPDGEPFEGPPGQRILPYTLIPASVRENALERGWQYPLLDNVGPQEAATAFAANQSEPGAPVLTMDAASRWSVPLPFARMTQGTLYIGHLFRTVGAFNLLSIGRPSEGVYSQGLRYDTGSYIAHAGTGQLTVTQDQVGGFGYLTLWAFTFAEAGWLRLYSWSPLGFQAHGSVPVGAIPPLATPRAYLGSSVSGASLVGQIFPGAPRFAAPAFTHRVHEAGEVREVLGRWHAHLSRFSAFTTPPPPYGLTLSALSLGEIVAGKTTTLELTVSRTGGFLGATEVLTEADDPAIRVVATRQDDDDEEDGGGGNGDAETWTITLTAEEGAEVREHTLSVVARAVGQPTSDVLKNVIAETQLTFQVRASAPAIAADAVAVHTMYSPLAHDLNVLGRNSVSSSFALVNQGLADFTSRGDGLRLDGTDIAPYGKSLWSVPAVLDMAADFTLHIVLWDADKAPFGTVFGGLASSSVKGDYLYLYRGQNGLQVKLAGGGGSNLTDTPNLAATGGVMHVTIRREGNRLTLANRDSNLAPFTDARAWSGTGRLSFGGVRQSDGTIIGHSRCIILGSVVHQRAVSSVQLERQAAYLDTFTLRTPAWARDEWPDGTDYICEAIGGEIYRNRHPATQSVFTNLTAVASPTTTGDSFKTNGSTQIVYTPVLNRSINAPNDSVIAMRDFRLGGNSGNKVQFGMTANGSPTTYFRNFLSPNANNKRAMNAIAPGFPSDLYQSASVVPTGDRTFSMRYRNNRIETEDIGNGEIISILTSTPESVAGNLVYSFGGTKRQDSTTQAQFFAVSETKGFILCARVLTTAEKQSAANNLQGTWDYSGAPVGGIVGSGPVINSFSASPSAVDPGNSTTLSWSVTGATSLSLSGVGTVTGTSATVTPGTTTTYTLTATNASGVSSTSSLTVTVTGTSGSSGGSFTAFSPQLSASYSKDTLYPAGSQARTHADILERAVALSVSEITGGLAGRDRVPPVWNGTETQYAQKREAEAGWNGGAYYTGRMDGIALDSMCWYARISRDPRWIAKIAVFVRDNVLPHYDFRGTAAEFEGWRETGRPKTLGMILGWNSHSNNNLGKRLHLEASCALGGLGHAMYILWENRHLSAEYATLSHRLRCLFVRHILVDWEAYQQRSGQLYLSDGVTRKYPESVRRKFFHGDSGEWQLLDYWALTETSMYNAGVTAPISVTMTGQDFASAQYSGAMIDATQSQTIGLHASTSASVSTHVGRQRAVLGVQNWYGSRSAQLMQASTFRDTAMRSRYPDGALVCTTGNAGAGATSDFFGAPTTYDNETYPHFLSLFASGVLTAARGSEAEATLLMKRLTAFKAVGSFADTASTGKVRRSGLGYLRADLNPSGVAGHVFNTSVPQVSNSYDEYGDNNGPTRGMQLGLSCFDSSGYLDQCATKLRSVKGTNGTNGTMPGASAALLMKHIFVNGRGG